MGRDWPHVGANGQVDTSGWERANGRWHNVVVPSPLHGRERVGTNGRVAGECQWVSGRDGKAGEGGGQSSEVDEGKRAGEHVTRSCGGG